MHPGGHYPVPGVQALENGGPVVLIMADLDRLAAQAMRFRLHHPDKTLACLGTDCRQRYCKGALAGVLDEYASALAQLDLRFGRLEGDPCGEGAGLRVG